MPDDLIIPLCLGALTIPLCCRPEKRCFYIRAEAGTARFGPFAEEISPARFENGGSVEDGAVLNIAAGCKASDLQIQYPQTS